ncbi:MAG TPA: hypothetical protein VGK19_07390 [Capsulimonadaceae bacterium]
MNYKHTLPLLLLAVTALTPAAFSEPSATPRTVIHRDGWSYDKSLIEWYPWAKVDQEKKNGTLNNLAGWAEYKFDVPTAGWYELFEHVTPEWQRDVFLDGKLLFNLTISAREDSVKDVAKEANLYLTAGSHTLRFRRLGFPGTLPSWWELRAADGDPSASIRAQIAGANVIRANQSIPVTFTASAPKPVKYDLVLRNSDTAELTDVGSVAFPATVAPLSKTVSVVFPKQGVFTLLGRVDGKLLRPADFKTGVITVIDTKSRPTSATALSRKLVAEVDCVKQIPLRDKDGPSAIVNSPLGSYRESSGQGTNTHWATDGFSYAIDIPDAVGEYQLEVDYPDNDRRTMGFWINDQSGDRPPSFPLTGGVDTGDRYRCSGKMLTHVATFWPLSTHLVFAAVNLNAGMKAAAAKVRIYKLEGGLDSGPVSRPDGRRIGGYYEESSRWLLHFGAQAGKTEEQSCLLTMDRWGQFNRYLGANLMFPTINVYQDNRFPSKVLEGYFNSTNDQCRMNALFAEKYGNTYIPEFHLSGQAWFDKHVMGLWYDEAAKDVKSASPEADRCLLRDKNGKTVVGDKFYYNCLNPKVQDTYIAALGELADDLGDCASFGGISSRLMLSWQWQAWNVLPGLNWGYDDYTVGLYTKETGVAVPGSPDDPSRYAQRYRFLTGPQREAWIAWRCRKVFAYHNRLLARIRTAKSTAKLYFTWYGQDPKEATSPDMLTQLRDTGMDPAMYAGQSGFVIIPTTSYGRRYSSPIADANISDPLFDKSTKAIALLGDRGGSVYGSYFEVGDPGWKAFGANNDRFMNDICRPAGRHELENFAILLADCDCSTLTLGAYGQIYQSPAMLREFTAEYTSLPALPFTALPSGRDPVAVWYRQCADGFYFYEVNRERYPVTTAIRLTAGVKPISLSGQVTTALDGGVLKLTLQPYQLRSFKVVGKANIIGFQADAPPAEREFVTKQLAFARPIAAGIRNRTLLAELSREQAANCAGLIQEADEALTAGQLWKARTNLERPQMMAIWDMLGTYPPKLQDRTASRGYVKAVATPAPKLAFAGAANITGDVRGSGAAVNSLSYDDRGNLWLATDDQVLQFDPGGTYLHSLRLTTPYSFIDGDIRGHSVASPLYLSPSALVSLPGDRVAALNYYSSMHVFETSTGRLAASKAGNGIALPGNAEQIARDAAGNVYVAVTYQAKDAGVYKYDGSGLPSYDFSGESGSTNRVSAIIPSGVAVDAVGRIYIGDRTAKTLNVYSPTGKLLETVPLASDEGPRCLAVSPDGLWIAVSVGGGYRLAGLQRDATGKLAVKWRQDLGGRIGALAFTKTADVAVGYTATVDGACVKSFRLAVTGATPTGFKVAAQDSIFPSMLSGRTPVRELSGAIYYISRNKLVKLTPGATDSAQVVYDPKLNVWSFAFAPNGDLYLGTTENQQGKRGLFLWRAAKEGDTWKAAVSVSGDTPIHPDTVAIRPFDLAVANSGELLVRYMDKGDWPVLRIFTRSADGTMRQVIQTGGMSVPPWDGYYGLHVDRSNGRVYVGGGPTHAIAALNPDFSTRWMKSNHIASLPGDYPLRSPRAITTDSKGRVWVADADANTILCFDGDGNYLASTGHFGTIDQRDGFSLCNPSGIETVVVGGKEWLYVADTLNQRLIKYAID